LAHAAGENSLLQNEALTPISAHRIVYGFGVLPLLLEISVLGSFGASSAVLCGRLPSLFARCSIRFDLNRMLRNRHAVVHHSRRAEFGRSILTPLVAYLHPDLDYFSAFVGVIAGGGSLFLIQWLYILVRREVGLGFGDVKLLAMIGGWLGYQSIFSTIFLASVVGSVFGILIFPLLSGRKMHLRAAIPFGPFLALGAFTHLIFGPQIRELLY